MREFICNKNIKVIKKYNNKAMHLAVLIYGRLNKCIEHYQNITESIGLEHTLDFFLSSDNSPDNLLQEFIHLYKPISYINDKIVHEYNFENYPTQFEANSENMTRHFINKSRVFELFEKYVTNNHSVKYDATIALRVDLVFHNKLVFPIHIEENTIYIPNGNDSYCYGLNDRVAYGNIDVMQKYMNIIHNVYYLLNNHCNRHPESLNFANMMYHRINICRFDINIQIER
jgi:hypothetical protein